ncbi:amidohydrolase [Paenarthrobacter ureafaciens]|nr:amidohydrolase [Paenarthrobacter ureafaciens]NWL26335.1 amidohydrolase [Paenarthrobacter ureafaciens]
MFARPHTHPALAKGRHVDTVEKDPSITAILGAPEPIARNITSTVESLSTDLRELSHGIHSIAEVGFEERLSVAFAAEFLRYRGFPVQVGRYGLRTSLRAEAGSGSPKVAVLAEYDALPGVGHGCGHNVICAAAVGAFLGVAGQVEELGGSVVLLGTPAEENGNGKELLARAGAFDDIDAAVMLHPFTGEYEVASFASLAVRDVEVTYHGVAAHASSAPHMGRNALDAVVIAYQGIAALRQHIPATDRLHCLITEGGSAVNVVPHVAGAVVEIRSLDPDGLIDISQKVQDILEGAALMTGTRLETNWDPFPAYLPVRSNQALATRYHAHISARGRAITLETELVGGGWSTDMGNLSLRIPSIHPTVSISSGTTPMHTAEFGQHAISPAGDAAVVDGAVGLALTIADYLADARLREQVKLDFEADGGPVDVQQLLTPPTKK